MANLPALIGDGARFIGQIGEDVREGLAAPGRQRRAQEAERARREQQRLADEARTQALRDEAARTTADLSSRTASLPVSTAEAAAAQGIKQKGAQLEHERGLEATNNAGAQLRATLPVIGDQNVRAIGAGAKADVERFGGWDSTVGARMQDIIAGAQQADQAVIDRFVGATPLSEQVLGLQREQMGMEQQRWEAAQNDPMRWVDAAGRLGLMASLIF
jgi:hypothetical protein